jgi:hypothetical protein
VTKQQHDAAITKLLKFFENLQKQYPKMAMSAIMNNSGIFGAYIPAVVRSNIIQDGKIAKNLNKDLAEEIVKMALEIGKVLYKKKKNRVASKKRSPIRVKTSLRLDPPSDEPQLSGDIVEIKNSCSISS